MSGMLLKITGNVLQLPEGRDLTTKNKNMIEIKRKLIGDKEFKVFTLLCDGFMPRGYVEMDCRLSDMDCEGEAFFINVTDETLAKQGDYAPLEMDKQELKQFIDYLKECYESMP
jgi:hypothetical protein